MEGLVQAHATADIFGKRLQMEESSHFLVFMTKNSHTSFTPIGPKVELSRPDVCAFTDLVNCVNAHDIF